MSSFEKDEFQYIDQLVPSSCFMAPQNPTCLDVKSDHFSFTSSASNAHESQVAMSKEGVLGIESDSNTFDIFSSNGLPQDSSLASLKPSEVTNSCLNLRYRNMLNFPTFMGKKSAAFDRRIKRAGGTTDPVITLQILRQFLQPFINRDINAVMTRYMEEFFSIAIQNMRSNLGENFVAGEEIENLQYDIMKSAAAQYQMRSTSPQQQIIFCNNPSSSSSPHRNSALSNIPSSDVSSSVRRSVLLRRTARRVTGQHVKPPGNISLYDFSEGFSDGGEGSVDSSDSKKQTLVSQPSSRLFSPYDCSVLSCGVSVDSLSSLVSEDDYVEDGDNATSPSPASSLERHQKPPSLLIHPLVREAEKGVAHSRRIVGTKRKRNNKSSSSLSRVILETTTDSPQQTSANCHTTLQRLEANHQHENTYQFSVDDSESHNMYSPLRLSVNDTFVLGSFANTWLGFGAARGRIYTKHPWLFRYECDTKDKAWLSKNGHLSNCGIKTFLMLAIQIRRLGESSSKQLATNRGALSEFRLAPWLVKKIIFSTGIQASESEVVNQLPAPPDLFQTMTTPMYPSATRTVSSYSNTTYTTDGNTLETLKYNVDYQRHKDQPSVSSESPPPLTCVQLSNSDGQCIPKLLIRTTSPNTTPSLLNGGGCIYSSVASAANSYLPINSPLYQRRSNSAAMGTFVNGSSRPSIVIDIDEEDHPPPKLRLMEAGGG